MSLGLALVGTLLFSSSTLAANAIQTKDYLDTDGDGTVDIIRWDMDENVTACAYQAGDWTVDTASEMNITITGLDCTGSDHNLDIEVSADANETGAATAPVISYDKDAGVVGSVTLTSGQLNDKDDIAADDGAAPVIVSTTPISAGSGISLYTNLVFTFSEDMDTAATYDIGGEVSITPSPGGWSNGVWSSTDTVLTFDTSSLLLCNTTYTIASTEAAFEDEPGNALVTTGPQDGDFTFFTGCVADDVMPSNVTVEVVGPACDLSEDTYTFSIDGDNIAEYLVSESSTFPRASWMPIPSSGEFTHTFSSNDRTIYVVVQSRNESRSSVYELTADADWSALCSEDEPEEEVDEEEEQDVEEEVEPVATAGSFVRGTSSAAVYYIDQNLARRPFVDSQTFFTWQSSFENVITLSDKDLATLDLGAPMLPKAGVVLVKVQSVDKVYWLESGANGSTKLRWITSEEDAISLFGTKWADYVIDVPSTMFTKFAKGTNVHGSEGLSRTMLKRRVDLK